MSDRRRYAITLHVLVVLGMLTYATAEQSSLLLLICPVLTGAAWLLVGDSERRPLPKWTINSMILGATALVFLRWGGEIGESVSAFSEYLVWLQLIKLFEPRSPRDDASILALSVMQVIGACLTSVTAEVGGMMLLYAPMLIYTVLQYQIHAGHERMMAIRKRSAPEESIVDQERWATGTRFRRSLSGAAALKLLIGLVATVGVFLLMPRGFGEGMLGQMNAPEQDMVAGFNDEVQLGAAGIISTSPTVVLEAKITRLGDGTAVGGRHLLRGAVLDLYDPSAGRWLRSDRAQLEDDRETSPTGLPPSAAEQNSTALLEVHLLPREDRYLFTIWRPRHIKFNDRTQYTRNMLDGVHRLARQERAVQYEVLFGQENANWSLPWPDRVNAGPFGSGPIHDYAMKILRDSNIDPDSTDLDIRNRIAHTIRMHIEKNFLYTVNLEAPAPGQDPIEMFLIQKRGHCEYFASAMAALCLAAGVEARVVTGYVLNEYDARSGTFTVRESDAHAWVEAKVFPGAWREFDPSPEEAVSAAQRPKKSWLARVRHAIGTLEVAWVQSVVNYDRHRQAAALSVGKGGALDGLLSRVVREPDRLGVETDSSIIGILKRLGMAFGAGLLTFGIAASALLILVTPARAVSTMLRLWLLTLKSRLWKAPPGARLETVYEQILLALQSARISKPFFLPPLAFAQQIAPQHPKLAEDISEFGLIYYEARFGAREENLRTALELLRDIQDHTSEIRRSLRQPLPQRIGEFLRSLRGRA